MSPPQTQEQSFGSDSGTIAASSRSSTYTTESSVANTSSEEFEDISEDIEIGTLPTINPQAVQNATSNKTKTTRSSKFRNPFKNFIYFQNAIITSAISMAIILPICLPPLYTDELKWTVSIVFKNIEVNNGTVDYHNGTIAPLNDVNLVGSNLTVQTCNFIDTADLCTNNAHHYFDIWWPCFILFVVLLNLSIWHFVTLRYRLIGVRSSGRRGD
ncbi:55ee9986-d3a6-487c-94e9-8c6cd4c41f3c [Sclerotinia trifoliorum]|uniref:55ee9986-d3a6-487c-94e9-8c6cd4c41f3c n=1 Tax=Sclerotinia trifoliorum TaxID=28548 RepID=A0A8H2VME2_9HELO|nr:55ee9986-d3a6-487c-94e9-8c6cd4c41f3c [Sclerotinia trifoliorum]